MGANKTKLGPVKEQRDSNNDIREIKSLDKQEEEGTGIGEANISPKVTLIGRNFLDARARALLSPIPVQACNDQTEENESGEDTHSARTSEFSILAHDVQSKTVNSGNQISAVETSINGNGHEVAIKAFKENNGSASAQHSPIQRTSRTDICMQTSKQANLVWDYTRHCYVQTEPTTKQLTHDLIGSNEDIDEAKKSENKHTEYKPVAEHKTIPPKMQEETMATRKKKRNPLKRESEKKKLKIQVTELQLKLQTHEKEIEDLKTRLSRVMGDRLTDNNPNIADLSNMNRPTKIAERFSELYDNQWTNLFETLTAGNKMGEKEAIHYLLETIKTIYNTCLKQSIDGYDRLQSTAAEFTGLDLEEVSRGYAHWLKVFKESRKHNYLKFLDQLERQIRTELEGSVHTYVFNSKDFKEYSAVATELCWLMCIQDPPVVMVTDCHRGEMFDKSLFRTYKRNGVSYSYPVWPALLLHTGGGILMKGVAQPKKGVHALFISPKHDTKVRPATS